VQYLLENLSVALSRHLKTCLCNMYIRISIIFIVIIITVVSISVTVQ